MSDGETPGGIQPQLMLEFLVMRFCWLRRRAVCEFGLICLVALSTCPLMGRPVSSSNMEDAASSSSWEGVDLSYLQLEVMRRGLADNQADASQIARLNLRFILENKINRHNFLIDPSPRDLVEKVSKVLELNNQIASLVRSGRQMISKRQHQETVFPREGIRILSEISDNAETLQEVFTKNFVETQGANVEVSAIHADAVGTFSYYLIQVDRLNGVLTRRVNDYFLDPRPGAVSVVEYSSNSITVLAEAIITLGDLNRKLLR